MPKVVPDLHQKILSTAEKHFRANGFEKADMHEIAEEADIAVGTIYLHYHNKETLYLHVVTRNWMRLFERIEALANNVTDPEPRLKRILETLVDEMAQKESIHDLWKDIGSIHHNQAGEDHPGMDHFSSAREPISKIISQALKEIAANHGSQIDESTADQLGSFAFVMSADACLWGSEKGTRNAELIFNLLYTYVNTAADN